MPAERNLNLCWTSAEQKRGKSRRARIGWRDRRKSRRGGAPARSVRNAWRQRGGVQPRHVV